MENAERKAEDTSRQGDWAEMVAAAWLMGQGYEVYRNLGSTGDADLVCWLDGDLFRVDVKFTRPYVKKDGTQSITPSIRKIVDDVRYLLVLPDESCMWWEKTD